ncbi:tRNA (N(6)-L-threonylcarbamoyladenosine(37)-C(2))-methylthiotransferase MtaB [bacterium]|nr:tRNA (N(6)-L-threonylcarbamoyladenosine(37)-C(2))-methylthiotransferase MtaB [bacterium]
MSKKTFKTATLGCRTNQYESAAFSTILKKMGWEEKSDQYTDLCIVNTCTVTASADQKSLYEIRKVLKKHPLSRVAVTGCMAERKKKFLEEIDPRVIVVPNSEKEQIMEKLFPDEENLPEFRIENFTANTRAFVKVQDGCNSYCSYCIIPFVRGRSRSRKIHDVVEEVEGLVENGYREIVLTGINIGDFDDDGGDGRLADLVRAVDAIDGVDRLRISSIDPDEVDEDLLDAVINGKKTCPSMHIVLQAGSQNVLNAMRRKYTLEDFFSAVNRLKAKNADFTFTTDMIVGFPGESEEDFQESLKVIGAVEFAKVHMFPYSDREKTRASRMENKIPKEVMERRRQELMKVAKKQAFTLRERYVGRTMKVLVEAKNKGHTENFLEVEILGERVRPNEIKEVFIQDNNEESLVGVLI